MEETCCRVLKNISRTKRLNSEGEGQKNSSESDLRKSLTTIDLTFLGLAGMVGVGLYVLSGVVAKKKAGPSIIVSYIVAGVAAMLAALCYAEIAGRVPRTGSAYTFTYIALGEIWAFFIGWSLFLEYILCAASIGTSLSGYIDSLCDHAISNFTINHIMGGATWDVPYIAPYPDLFAGLLNIFIGLLVMLGTTVSSWASRAFFGVNFIMICIIFGVGMKYGDIANWQDYGGFAPYGIGGTITGAAVLFYSFVGFDVIAMCNEEAIDPKESVPRASCIAITVTVTLYILSASALTLMAPYTDLNPEAPFTIVFQNLGVYWAQWIVGIGAISGMIGANLGSHFCSCRLIYAMSKDGLFFTCLSTVNNRTKIPIRAQVVSLVIIVITNVLFSLEQLVSFLSIGTLCAFIFVAYTVIVLRYQPAVDIPSPSEQAELSEFAAATDNTTKASGDQNDESNSITNDCELTPKYPSNSDELSQSLINKSHVMENRKVGTLKDRYRSTPVVRHLASLPPGRCVMVCVVVTLVCKFVALGIVERGSEYLLAGEWWAILTLVFFLVIGVATAMVIPLHHQGTVPDKYYSVRFVPLVPIISILCCLSLALRLGTAAWLRFLIWLAIGLLVYIFYGYRNSAEAANRSDDRLIQNGPEDCESTFYGTTSSSGH